MNVAQPAMSSTSRRQHRRRHHDLGQDKGRRRCPDQGQDQYSVGVGIGVGVGIRIETWNGLRISLKWPQNFLRKIWKLGS